MAENPKEFYGQTVTVAGVIIEILEPGVFVIDDPRTPPNEDLLVAGYLSRFAGRSP